MIFNRQKAFSPTKEIYNRKPTEISCYSFKLLVVSSYLLGDLIAKY